jgi:DNA-binding MarR family transcriptional regulator
MTEVRRAEAAGARPERVLSRARAPQVAGQLETLGLVRRTRDRLDGRAVIVEPTRAVERGWTVARAAVAGVESPWRNELGERRYQAMVDAIERLVALDVD